MLPVCVSRSASPSAWLHEIAFLNLHTHFRVFHTYSLLLGTYRYTRILIVFVLVDKGPVTLSEYLEQKKRERKAEHP